MSMSKQSDDIEKVVLDDFDWFFVRLIVGLLLVGLCANLLSLTLRLEKLEEKMNHPPEVNATEPSCCVSP